MNILGALYRDGKGTTVNYQEALKWFELSAEKGYFLAYDNLGNMYRKGWGVEQDFKRAYQLYKKGAAVNFSLYEKGAAVIYSNCIYDQGYMLYKGLGVTQNYPKAIALYRRAIKLGSPGSMYMLGLCFRNGYGIAQNADSAQYWLNLSASKGYPPAKKELLVPVPEVISYQLLGNIGKSRYDQNKTALANIGKAGNYQTYHRVEHAAKSKYITGEYSGFMIRYDFSGKHVIGYSELRLNLEAKDNIITGSWAEEEIPVINLQAEMSNSGLVFNNTAYMKTDHYSIDTLRCYLFKNARLQIVQQKDSIYLVGNMQLWEVRLNEPDKPIYISLVKNTTAVNPVRSTTGSIKQ